MPRALRLAAPEQAWISELTDFVRIPSISSDPTRRPDVAAAANWLARFADRMTDDVEVVETENQPLVLARICASNGARRAPRVLVYGHFDVQPVGDEADWQSPPFEPEVRGDWLYGRGVTDDKGNLYMLLKATEQLARAGALPVDVFVACDGEEECGGDSLVRHLAADTTAIDAAILFDGQMPAHDVPVFKLGTRGLVYLRVSVRTGERPLHSGAYGGVALNAADALLTILDSVRHLPEFLRSGTTPPAPDEIPNWAHLPDGRAMLDERGARPQDEHAVARFHQRTLAEPALDIHGIDVGEAHLTATSIPVAAAATLSIRLAAGQDPDGIASACSDALRSAAPTGADVTVEVRSAIAPSFTSSTSPVIRIGLDAFERTLGRRPLLTRSGGSVPVRAALSGRSIPTIHTGFDVPSGNAHAPDERLYLPYLTAGITAARETLLGLGTLNGHAA